MPLKDGQSRRQGVGNERVVSHGSPEGGVLPPCEGIMWDDELHDIGLEAFTRRYDPYWDVPLVESLPKPVIELPEVAPKAEAQPGEIVQRDLFGNVVQTNLFGEVVWPSEGKRKRKRR